MSEVKKQELKSEVQALSDIIGSAISVNAKEGKASITEGIWEANLPEDVTPSIVKSLDNYTTTFVAAGLHAFGKASVDAMKGNKTLDSLSLSVPMIGKNSVDFTVERSKVTHSPKEPTVDILKYGVSTTTLTAHADNRNAGQLKIARSMIAEYAMEHLSKAK